MIMPETYINPIVRGGGEKLVDKLNQIIRMCNENRLNVRTPELGMEKNIFDGTRIWINPKAPFFYGKTEADFTSGASIVVTLCDANGVDMRPDGGAVSQVTVNLPSSIDIGSYDAGGGSEETNCKLPAGSIITFGIAQDGEAYVTSEPFVVLPIDEAFSYDEENHELKVVIQFNIGGSLTNVSDALTVKELTAAPVMIDYRFDTVSGKLQKKTANIYVFEAEETSNIEWEDVYTPEDCPNV
jgi:hypothetical protein